MKQVNDVYECDSPHWAGKKLPGFYFSSLSCCNHLTSSLNQPAGDAPAHLENSFILLNFLMVQQYDEEPGNHEKSSL